MLPEPTKNDWLVVGFLKKGFFIYATYMFRPVKAFVRAFLKEVAGTCKHPLASTIICMRSHTPAAVLRYGGPILSVLVSTILNFISLEKGMTMYLIIIGPQP